MTYLEGDDICLGQPFLYQRSENLRNLIHLQHKVTFDTLDLVLRLLRKQAVNLCTLCCDLPNYNTYHSVKREEEIADCSS